METIAIHENSTSDKVINFVNLINFSLEIERAYNNNTIFGFYYKDDLIYFTDIWGGEHQATYDLSSCQ